MFKKFKWLSITILSIIFIAAVLIILSVIPGSRPGHNLLSEMLIRSPSAITVSEYSFDVGRRRAFAHADGSVAAAGTLGVQVLGPDGRELLRDSVLLSAPAIIEKNSRFLAFDVGGTAARVFNNKEILISYDTEHTIVSAALNKNGRFCIITQEKPGGERGTATVYSETGKPLFEVRMGSGFMLSAELSDDNKHLAVLSITQAGSRITVYDGIDTDKESPDYVYEFDNEVILDIEYLSNTKLLVFGRNRLRTIDTGTDDPVSVLYDYGEKKLGGYAYTGQFAALHLYDYNIGYSGQVVTLSFDGTVLGQLETSFEVSSMSAGNDTLLLLSSEGVLFCDKNLSEHPVSGNTVSAATAGCVLALGEDMALAANDLSASVIRRGDIN